MPFYADLHIHSKYSRATSRDCDLENLTFWGRKKGISVIGTGDFTHPAWIQEIKDKLVPAEPGLFRLRNDLEAKIFEKLPPACRGETRFILSVEISTIYKKGDKVRKIHHLVYAPSIEKAERIIESLSKIGNLRSDGRPILGLDSRHLLEIVLEAGEDCYIVPAHIWTPWFAVLGSKSGFDAVQDCYGDLTDYIYAVETGLSSDPKMNWRVSSLDRFRLISNSDAHSPPKLGREATVFDGYLNYYAMLDALKTGKGYGGTIEFFPEEGKYHCDGHRKCEIRLTPQESRKHQGKCPACKGPLTLGVLYRVEELADRALGQRPQSAGPFKSIIPLPEILGEIAGVGPSSKKVLLEYEQLLARLGSEFQILTEIPLDEIQRHSSSLLAEAISRMRNGKVIREAGYDGEYGIIKLFEEKELKDRERTALLFETAVRESPKTSKQRKEKRKPELQNAQEVAVKKIPAFRQARIIAGDFMASLDDEQRAGVEALNGAVLIIAGPGSGKTRTLTCRIANLIKGHGARPEQCLTITFTRRAADEMRNRLAELLPEACQKIPVLTFHALGYQILQENAKTLKLPADFDVLGEEELAVWIQKKLGLSAKKVRQCLKEISLLKRNGEKPPRNSEAANVWKELERARKDGRVGYDDLIRLPLELFEKNQELARQYQKRFKWISVDEYQDIDPLQYRLLRLLSPAKGNLCVIGDPDQAIYGFRGSDVGFFLRFTQDLPDVRLIQLKKNYRSGESILSASSQMIFPSTLVQDRQIEALIRDTGKVTVHRARSDKAETEFVVHSIENMIGGHSFFSLDSGRSDGNHQDYSFSDFCVLYRTEAQLEPLKEAFSRSGIPFQAQTDRDMDLWDARADKVSLMTLHAAKGLEFPVVFIAGCEDGILPLRWGKESKKEEADEERRLFYVGMTRAKDKLILSYAAKRLWRGKVREQQESPFLKDIEQRLLERREAFLAAKKARDKKHQMDLF